MAERSYQRTTGPELRAKPILVAPPASPAERVNVFVSREILGPDGQVEEGGAKLEHHLVIDGADPAPVEIRVR